MVYFLVKDLFKNTTIGKWKPEIIASLLLAIEPWSLFLSRGAFEANLALFFFVSGMYFFFRSLKNSHTTYNLLLTATFFGLTVWTYNSYRVFTPLMLITLFVIYRKELFSFLKYNIKPAIYFLLLTSIFFVPMVYQLLNPIGQARYGNLAILDSGAINQINEQRNNSEFSPPVSRLLLIKVLISSFITNYISFRQSSLQKAAGLSL
jgi:hypothetical protein